MSEHTDPTAAPGADTEPEQERESQSRDMLLDLQQMIDTVAAQAGPVLRDVAAKAAELAAVAAERAGPIAHRAADATERVGVRVAARTKEMAEDLRRQRDATASETAAGDAADGPDASPGPDTNHQPDAESRGDT